MTASSHRTSGIEVHSIDHIPASERHGRVAEQGSFWFLNIAQFFTVSIGFIGPSLGLSFGYTVLAGTLGILFGTIFMAFHATQGPELGLPQMIQSRAQFGYRGVVIPLVSTLIAFVGFNVVNTLVTAIGLNGIFGWSPTAVTIVITLVSAGLAIYGHDWLHLVFRWLFFLCVPLYAVVSAAILFGAAGGVTPSTGGFVLVAFVAQFTAAASNNLTLAPFVSDYSRYLPRHTPAGKIIGAVFLGAGVSGIWMIALGAWLATRMGASDGLSALNSAGEAVFPGFGGLVALGSAAVLTAVTGANGYSAMLTVVTAIDAFRPLTPSRAIRVATILALALVWGLLSLVIGGDVVDTLLAALTIILYVLVPWTAVNLVDYFFVRRGRYAITDLFTPRGIYGAWGRQGLTAFALGFAAATPFLVLPGIYTGPLALMLGGVDVGWLVGLVVSSAAYALLTRAFDPRVEAGAIARSDAELARLGGDVASGHEDAARAGGVA